MKQYFRMVLFFVCLTILICLSSSQSDQIKEELEKSWEKHFTTPRVYVKTTTDGDQMNNNSERPRVSLCCRVGTFLTETHGCMEITTNETEEMVQLPVVYDINLIRENISMSDKYFNFVIWNPCAGGHRYFLDSHTYENDKWYLMSNGSIWRPKSLEKPILDYRQYCLARINSTEYREYLAFVCMFKNNNGDEKVMIFFYGGMLVSVPFLIATYVVYWLLPELRNLHGLTLRGYIGCLATAYSTLGMQVLISHHIESSTCIVLAFISYFSFLASFFWLNVICFDIWWTFREFRSSQGNVKQRERKKFIIYSIYAWGSASILTIICGIMDFVSSVPRNLIRPELGVRKCWLSTKPAITLYFYGPMGITVICNICLFISTALKIVDHKKDTAHHLRGLENRRHNENKQWFNLYLKLFIVMGISWSMEIVSWLFDSVPQYVWYLTDLINVQQGLIIFIIFVWKKKIKRLLLKRFGCQNLETSKKLDAQ